MIKTIKIMKRRKPKDVNLKPYDMWTDEDYENAIPQEVRDAFDKVTQKPKSYIDLDYITEELDKFVNKPNGDFGYGTLYDVATHFYKLGIKDSQK